MNGIDGGDGVNDGLSGFDGVGAFVGVDGVGWC